MTNSNKTQDLGHSEPGTIVSLRFGTQSAEGSIASAAKDFRAAPTWRSPSEKSADGQNYCLTGNRQWTTLLGSHEGITVNNRALLALFGSVLALTLAFPVSASAQAAAESALTNSLSSSATVKAGSALSHALNQSSTQLGARIQERTSGPVRVGAQPTSTEAFRNHATGSLAGSAVHTGSSSGTSTISVQGGEGVCVPNPASQAAPDKTGSGTAANDCHQKSSPKPETSEDKYKSFVTLSFPK